MRDPIRIKQIMPITDGYTVLSPVGEGNGITNMEDLTQSGWHYLFALIDGGEWDDDYVAMYEMDATGYGEIDVSGCRIVPKRKCPKCGLEMTPCWDDTAPAPLSYTCSCTIEAPEHKHTILQKEEISS